MNYIEHWLIGVSTITRCLSISDFSSLVEIPTRIASSTIGLKVCVITTGIEKCKSIIKEIWKKHNKIVLLAKSKLNTLAVLISKALIESNISHDEFIVIIDVLKEFHDMKEEIKYSNDK